MVFPVLFAAIGSFITRTAVRFVVQQGLSMLMSALNSGPNEAQLHVYAALGEAFKDFGEVGKRGLGNPSVRIEVDEVTPFLEELLRRGENLEPAFNEIGPALVDSARLRFGDSVGPDGEPWPPLAASTIAKRRGGSDRPLLDTGGLRNSITYEASRDSLVIGTNYLAASIPSGAAILQLGGFAGRDGTAHIPPRPFLGISAEDREEIDRILHSYFEEAAP